MLIEVTDQRLGQLRDLGPQLPLGQAGQLLRIPLSVDHLSQHRPCRDRLQTRHHRRQLDARVLEHQLEADHLSRPISQQLISVTGQQPKAADLRRRHERRSQQAVLEQLRDPLRVPHVGLAAGDGLHVLGVEQPHGHDFFEAVERRLPVRRGRLDRRDRHPFRDEPVPHHAQRAGHRREGPRLAAPPTRLRARGPHAHRHRRLAHIQPGHAFEHDFHPDHPLSVTTTPTGRPAGVARKVFCQDTDPRARSSNQTAPEDPAPYTSSGSTTRTSVFRRPRTTPPILIPRWSDRFQDRNLIHLLHRPDRKGSDQSTGTSLGSCTTFGETRWAELWS